MPAVAIDFNLNNALANITQMPTSVLEGMLKSYTESGKDGLIAEIQTAYSDVGAHGEHQFSPKPNSRQVEMIADAAIARGKELGFLQ